MRIVIAKDYDDMSRRAASVLAGVMLSRADCILGLATGSSPIGTYRELIRLNQEGIIDFSKVRSFNLDEYYRLPGTHDQSYNYFMHHQLFDHVNIAKDAMHFPDQMSDDPGYGKAYDDKIAAAGGIDIQLLGLGHDGHIGFNEPQDDFPEYTHRVKLTGMTIQANKRFFASEQEVPREAVTMGIGTIMRARQILMVVSGTDKARTVREMAEGPVTPQCPASVLRFHPNVTVILDEAAASLLTR